MTEFHMNGYVVLIRYTPTGAQFATPADARRRLQRALQSATETLGGRLLSLDATLGVYDYVARLDVPPGQDLTILQCKNLLCSPGDIEVTVLRAFGFDDVFPVR